MSRHLQLMSRLSNITEASFTSEWCYRELAVCMPWQVFYGLYIMSILGLFLLLKHFGDHFKCRSAISVTAEVLSSDL